MKITFDIECTPEEARRLMGMPDVSPLNEALMDQLRSRVENGFSAEDMDSFVRSMVTGAGAGMSELQKMIWGSVKAATKPRDKDDNKDA